MQEKEALIKRIEEIEEKLEDLKIAVKRSFILEESTVKEEEVKDKIRPSASFEEGEQVIILNPKPGQQKEGRIKRYNSITGWATVTTVDGSNIRRLKKNIRRRSDYKQKTRPPV